MNYNKTGALIRTGFAGLAAAFAGGALAVGAARYMPQQYECIEEPTGETLQPVHVAPAPRQSVPGLFV